MRRLAAIALLFITAASSSSLAVQPDEMLKDPALEARARELSRELRCMVCQNQSIDESDAPLARDLRLLVRERLTKGDTDRQVLDFLVVRYGEFVLLKPPLDSRTIILWALPPIALLAGAIGLYFAGRRHRLGQLEPATLSNDERLKLSTLVDKHPADP
jgi:cytochrome c-type biogenesis protein CcmH